MMGFVQPIGKARHRKSGVAGVAADPVAMQKGVEMFGGVTCSQMIQIGVPYPVMGSLL